MKTILQLIKTFIPHLVASETTSRKMPALIPVRVITKVNRDQY